MIQEASRIKLTHQSICLLRGRLAVRTGPGTPDSKPRTEYSGGAFLWAFNGMGRTLPVFRVHSRCAVYLSPFVYLASSRVASELLSKIIPGNSICCLSGPGHPGLSCR